MEFSNSVTIGRPPAEVFDYLAHCENVPAWNFAITSTEKNIIWARRRGNDVSPGEVYPGERDRGVHGHTLRA